MKRKLNLLVIASVIGFTLWSFGATEFDLEKIRQGFFVKPYFGEFLRGLWPLNWSILPEVASQSVLTIQIAWIGTLLATVAAIPLSFLGARNTAPTVAVGSSIRFFFNVDRSIDVLIVALILVAAVGLGPLAGTIAIAIHSIGSLGKLFIESIEAVDSGPVEALESTGATRSQVIRWGVLPQVLPYLVSYVLYRLELNIRSAVVLGIVGAGGIGDLLTQNIRQFQYHNVSMILLVIVVLVVAIDLVSSRLRRMVV
jgi:phosphonate ABC transporter permease subunit PhnE